MKDKLGNFGKKAANKLHGAAKNTYDKTMGATETILKHDRVKGAIKGTKDAMKKTGRATTKAVQTSTQKVQDTTDTITGTKQLALVNERLLEQQKFNEAVATRVLDILDRLEKLELRLNELMTEKGS